MPDHRDRYYYLAKKERYRSRAAFKLIELQTKFNLLSEGQRILEIGSSPGGWSQIISSITRSKVMSVDLNQMDPLEGVIFVKGKVGTKQLPGRIREEMERNSIDTFQGILSDAMINTSGNNDIDHASSYLICQEVMKLATEFLSAGGFVVVKQFYGDLTTEFVNKWSGMFQYSKITKVAASRDASKEVYIIFKGYRS
ncbi:MAG: RlmE family RNA methyltransferase [Candidatus Thermoplasmatota archaeon]|nr:RlmE family RNA methyltransferase [Candidatus Thermoplasmatota archaeon]